MILPDKIYNVLKWILITVVPALNALIVGLGLLYGFSTEVIVGTISLLATFVGALIGVSTKAYNSKNQ